MNEKMTKNVYMSEVEGPKDTVEGWSERCFECLGSEHIGGYEVFKRWSEMNLCSMQG